jgi:hypothetical protein
MHTPVPALPTARRAPRALLGVAAAASLALSACSSPIDPPYTDPRPNLDHGCADGAAANGFPCTSLPGTGHGIYPDGAGRTPSPPGDPRRLIARFSEITFQRARAGGIGPCAGPDLDGGGAVGEDAHHGSAARSISL